MSYTKSVYQKKCTKCAEIKVGACSRHFFMFLADSKTEELYCKNINFYKLIDKDTNIDKKTVDSNLNTYIPDYQSDYQSDYTENPITK